MKKILGLCNLCDGPHLEKISLTRPLGTTTFLGRYSIMDFTLSNFSNSGIDRVGIIIENHVQSIRSHTRDGNIWINNTKKGFQRLLINENGFSNPKFNTDINNLIYNKEFLIDLDMDYVVIAPVFFLMSFNFKDMIKAHEESGEEITVLYTKSNKANEKFINCDNIRIDSEGLLFDASTVSSDTKKANVSLEAFVINRDTLFELLEKAPKVSSLFNIRQLVYYLAKNNLKKVNTYEYKGYVAPILTMNDYVKYSFDMLSYQNRTQLFNEDWPIYTTSHNTPPSLYGKNADVNNSFIANGSIIKGKVINSIISRDVIVEEGVVIENCILFTKTKVDKDTKLKYVLADKKVNIKQIKNVEGKEDEIFYIALGANI